MCIFPWCGKLEIALLFMGSSAAAHKLGIVGLVPLCGEGSFCSLRGGGQGLAGCSGTVSVCLPASLLPAWSHPDEQHSSVKCAYEGQVLGMTCLWQLMPVVTDWVSVVPTGHIGTCVRAVTGSRNHNLGCGEGGCPSGLLCVRLAEYLVSVWDDLFSVSWYQ